MSCRRAEDAFASILSLYRPCRAHGPTPHARGTRLLSTASGVFLGQRRPLRRGHGHVLTPHDARRRVHIDGMEFKRSADNLPDAPRVAILGGGISGLTAAYYLAQDLPPKSKIVLYEGEKRVGGWIRSERVPVDVAGTKAEVLFERGPRLISLSDGFGGREDRLVVYDILLNHGLIPVPPLEPAPPRYIWHDGQLVRMPPNVDFAEALQTSLFWQVFPRAVFHYLVNSVLQAGQQVPERDVSVAQYMYSLFGSRRLVDVITSSLMHGTWGGDVYKLSAASVFGWVFHAMGLTQPPPGMFRMPRKEAKFLMDFWHSRPETREATWNAWENAPHRMMMVGKYGLEAIPQGLANSLGSASNVNMNMGSRVKDISYNKERNAVMVKDSENNVEAYDKVISTLPAQKLAMITGDNLPILSEFHSVTIMTVNIWYPKDNLLPPGVGYLIPASVPEKDNPERALGVFFDSNISVGDEPNHSEPGTKLFVLMGGHYYDGVQPPSETQAVDQAKSLLERQLGISRETPCHATASLAEECLPQHYVDHSTRLSHLHKQLQDKFDGRLATVGGSFGKPGVAPGVRAGWDIASAVVRDDFFCSGLEDYLEESALRPPFVTLPKEGHMLAGSAMRKGVKQ